MLAATGELDDIISGRGLTFTITDEPPPPPPPKPQIPPADWEQEAHEQALRAQPREPDPPLHTEDVQTLPAKPKRRATKTPRLDQVRKLIAADRGQQP
jgi:hypothetical protein